MNVLHTSDWHLGQSFFTQTRKAEHQAFLQWLLSQVTEHHIDAIIVAGDIFDTGTPPSYARQLYNQFIVELQSLNCSLVVLGGNHDSVATLNESRQLLAQLNTVVVASAEADPEQQIIVINNAQGEPGAIICAIPFLRPRDLVRSSGDQSAADKRQALEQAITDHYQQLFVMAQQHQQQLQQQTQRCLPIIMTGHLAALGVSQSESVRDIYIGTMEGFPAHHFPAADYIALGHIHRPQRVADTDHIRYSGSPIPLSFDELKSQKQVVIVAFDEASTTPQITPLAIPIFQPMQVLTGELSELAKRLPEMAADYNEEQPLWLAIEVVAQDYLSDLQQRIQSMTDGLPVEVLQLRRQRNPQRQALTQDARETLAELAPADVFARRLAQETFSSPEEQAREQRLKQQFAEVLAEVQQRSS